MNPGSSISAMTGLRGHPRQPRRGKLFVKNLDRSQLADLMAKCDAFVLPSHGEAWCQWMLEALAMGLPVVTTRFGFHLIQVMEKSGDTIHARHILARLGPGPEDGARAAALAESVGQRAAAGEDFAALAAAYSDDPRSSAAGGVLGWFTPDDLVPEFRATIEALAPGGVGPILQGDGGYYVLKLLSHEEARTATLDEVRPKLREFLMNQRMEEEYRKLIDRLSGEIYVDLRGAATPSP
jgi:hypothetical protein